MGDTTAPYSSLAAVYDRWMVDVADYAAMVERCRALLAGCTAPRVLDVCVGTGVLAAALVELGATVVGVDASDEMLAIARDRLSAAGPRCALHRLDVVHDPWPEGPWDLVTLTGDSANYFAPDELAGVLGRIGSSLAPGGWALLDLNTPHKLVDVFADTTYATSWDDFAYIWENSPDPDGAWIDFHITLFHQQEGPAWRRTVERHRQFVHQLDEVERQAAAAGLELASVTASYADHAPAPPDAMRWVIEARRT